MVLNDKNGGFFLDLDSSDAKPVTLDLGPDKEPEEAPQEEASPMTLTVDRAEGSTAPSPAAPQSPAPKTTTASSPAKATSSAKPGTPKPSLTTAEAIAAELAAACTVVIASGTGLPISTTQTLVGAVLGVGLARGVSALNLGIVRNIVVSWIVTLPAGAILSIIFFYILKAAFGVA